MHPARFNFLAYGSGAIRKPVVSKERNECGHWVIKLACGHEGSCVGHMVPTGDDWYCTKCSEENVRTNPRWSSEWGA